MPGGPELLLSALRRGPSEERAPLDGASDAAWVSMLAVTPLDLRPYLADRLPQLVARERIPAAIREALAPARRAGAVGHLQRQALLRRMTRALDREGVPFVVLKGMVLAHLAYPDPALRPMDDIDLWTRPEHLDAGARALLGAGLQYPERLVARKAAADRPEAAPTRMFELPGSGLIVELHGRLQSMTAACPEWEEGAWSRRIRAAVGGVDVQVLDEGDMLSHLAIHCSAHHRFEMGLRALLDIALWLEYAADRLSWPALRERWTRDSADTWIYLTLSLTRELLNARVPAEYFRDSVPPASLDSLLALARAQILDPTRTMPPALTRLSTLPSLGARLRWLANRLTSWYWTGREDTPRTPLEAVRQAGRRMAHDVRHKLPPYVHGLVSGNLRGEEYRRRKALAIGRDRMAELVALEEQARRRGEGRRSVGGHDHGSARRQPTALPMDPEVRRSKLKSDRGLSASDHRAVEP